MKNASSTSNVGPGGKWLAICLSIGFVVSRPALAGDRTVAVPPQLTQVYRGSPPRDLGDLKALQRQILEITEKVIPCTVGVLVGAAHGSGVIVSPNGYVLTAAHVAGRPDNAALFMMADGRVLRGKSLGMDVKSDIALMKITDEGQWPYAEMGDSGKLRNGQWCLATGYPGGYGGGREPVLRMGRIISTWQSTIRTDCTLSRGDSGGPLFDLSGRVIGIHSRVGASVATNLHVSIREYREDWDRLVAGHVWGLTARKGPYIGVEHDVDSPQARIRRVQPGSPALAAGLRAGDVITEFGGKRVDTFRDLGDAVRSKRPGDMVTMTVRRDEGPVKLTIRIGGSDH